MQYHASFTNTKPNKTAQSKLPLKEQNRIMFLWRRTEVVVPGRTRNAFVGKPAREFESHRLRQDGENCTLVSTHAKREV